MSGHSIAHAVIDECLRLSPEVIERVSGYQVAGTITIIGEATISGEARIPEVMATAARRKRNAARRHAAQLETSRYVVIPGVRRPA